jgi:hypothetical protein
MAGYPKITLIPPNKPKIAYRFALSLLTEYENGSFNVLTIPEQLSPPEKYDAPEAAAFLEGSSAQNGFQHFQEQYKGDSDEKLAIVSNEAGGQPFFEYQTSFAIDDIPAAYAQCIIEENIQSIVHMKNLKFEVEIQEQVMLGTAGERCLWTTAADLSLFEDLFLKLCTDQDIVVRGIPGS